MKAVNEPATHDHRERRPARKITSTTRVGRFGRQLGSVLLFLLWGQLALAQEPGEVAAPDAGLDDRHRVEVIVFRHLDQRGTTAEEAQVVEPAATLVPDDSALSPETTRDAVAVQELSAAELKLGAIAAKLRQSAAYRLLYHGGWLQSFDSRERATPTPLPAAARAAGLDGTITLYRENYLHALLDIGLREPSANKPGAEVLYVLRQGRRLRGTTAQYFDHPQFGLILLAE